MILLIPLLVFALGFLLYASQRKSFHVTAVPPKLELKPKTKIKLSDFDELGRRDA